MKVAALSLLLGLCAFAQSIPLHKTPAPPADAPEPNLPPSLQQSMPDAPRYSMPLLDVRSLPRVTDKGSPAVGEHRPLPAGALRSGAWTQTRTGHALWRLRVTTPEAMAVRVHLQNFHVGAGRVWVHNGQTNRLRVFGPFTRDGIFHDGDFWTSFIFGDSLVIEYEAPGSAQPATLPFAVEGITHLWEFLGKKSLLAPKDVDTSCELDATCYAGDSDVADSIKTVVMLLVPAGQNLYTQCTGTMLNDKNSTGTPYLLTAGHCLTSDGDARAVTVIWNYQSGSCNASVADLSNFPTVTGATLLSQNLQPGGLDYAFAQLSAKPNANWLQAGWTTEDVAQNQTLTSISHPRALPKRYAELYQDGNSTGFADSYEFTTSLGRVDHGSSGSALFSGDAQVRATLSTAQNPDDVSSCTVAVQVTDWTKFSSIYSNTSNWLQDQVTQQTSQPAVMQSPAPGSTLAGSTVTFSWNDVNASEYFISVGTSSGAKDIFAQNVASVTSYTVGGLPTNGSTLYVRLWSHLPDAWYYNDYTYQAASSGGGGGGTTTYAQMTAPPPGSTLTGSSVTFSWTTAATASQYFLYAGTSAGGKDLFAQNVGTHTSYTVGGLPTNGATIYIRLWSHLPNAWYYFDYTYTAASGGGGGGGGTTMVAQMTSPTPGSTLTGSSVTFSWTMSATASEYFLYIGTTSGGKDLLAQNVGTVTSYTVGGLPTDGSTIYVRLWSNLPNAWYYIDYTYTAASGGGGGGGTTMVAEMISPVPGSVFTDSTVTFYWTEAATASEYFLYVGSTLGGNDLFGQNVGNDTSFTVFGLPTDGSTLYVRLWSHLPAGWYYYDYQYYAVSGS
jgi:hypothetical protein